MICDQCETVAHCIKHGCVPKQPAPVSKDEALKLALEALEKSIAITMANIDLRNKAITAIKQALAAPVQEPFAWCIDSEDSADWCFAKTEDGVKSNSVFMDEYCIKTNPFPLYTTPPAAPVQNSDHEFKNFHRVLCERFGYTHDEVDWKRDQVSLIEWIAKQVNPAAPVREPYAWHYKNAGGVSAWHFGPSRRFDADLDASERWPKTHQLIPVYTTPPAAQQQWVGLTHDEYDAICDKHSAMSDFDFLEDIEAKLKEKNT